MQTIFPPKDGSALRLTTSKYFTPSGRSIHGQGIPPDVEVPFERAAEEKPKSEQTDEVFKRVETGVKPDEKSVTLAERKRQDNQLARAIDLLKGLKVYQTKEHVIN